MDLEAWVLRGRQCHALIRQARQDQNNTVLKFLSKRWKIFKLGEHSCHGLFYHFWQVPILSSFCISYLAGVTIPRYSSSMVLATQDRLDKQEEEIG